MNDELKKIEKNIVTHDSLERLKSSLNLQLKELKQDVKERKKVTENLNKVQRIEDKIENIEENLEDLDQLSEEIDDIKIQFEKTKKNFVNWQEFFDKVKEITKEDNDKAIDDLKKEYEEEFDNLYDTINEIKKDSTSNREFKKIHKNILSRLKKETIERKKLMAKIKEQAKEIKELKKGSNKQKKKEKESNLFWPISILTLIILALIVGMFFWGPSLMSPSTYANPEDLQCKEKFECRNINDSMYLVNCSFDNNLNDCHCSVLKNPNKCIK